MLALTIVVILPIVYEFFHAIAYPRYAEKIIYTECPDNQDVLDEEN